MLKVLRNCHMYDCYFMLWWCVVCICSVCVSMYVVCTCVRTYKGVTVCILSEYIKGHLS